MCNACGGSVRSPPAPGTLNVTQAQFDDLVIQQLTELWSIAPLAEVWFVSSAVARAAGPSRT